MSQIQKREKEGEGHEQRGGECLVDSGKTELAEAERLDEEIVGEKVSKGIQTLEAQPTEFQLYLLSDTKVTEISERSFDMSKVVF